MLVIPKTFLCQILFTTLTLAHSSAVVKILSCLFFPCPVVSETLFRHVILLFDINTNGQSLLWFHAYLAGTNLVSCFFTGGLAVSMTGNIPSWCFLITTSLVCLFNLLHSLAFLVLTLYVGLHTSHNMATAAVTFFILAVLQETLKNQIKQAFFWTFQKKTQAQKTQG